MQLSMDVFKEFWIVRAVRILVGGFEDAECLTGRRESEVRTGGTFAIQFRVNAGRYR